jgi:ankyrin repeat protein
MRDCDIDSATPARGDSALVEPVPLEDYRQRAAALLAALQAGEDDAAWRFKWEHPSFRDRSVGDVRAATLDAGDAQLVVARESAFDTWADLVAFARAVVEDPQVIEFETAVEAVVAGDVATLQSMLQRNPSLAHMRSTRRHHATLLHYVAANGVEGIRQKTPANAIDVARTLLDAGADADALADRYDAKCTTMSMLVSCSHVAEAGVQAELAELLLDRGAALEGPGTNWQSAVLTALTFGYLRTAPVLARRGGSPSLETAAGLGDAVAVARLLPSADAASRHAALALAAQHGHSAILRLLAAAGEDPNRYNPKNHHAHATPLHQAVWGGHLDAVRVLVELGARLDLRDTIYSATPLEWAVYGGRTEIERYLREREAGLPSP